MGAAYEAGLVARFERVCARAWTAIDVHGTGRMDVLDWSDYGPDAKTRGVWVRYEANFDEPLDFGSTAHGLESYLEFLDVHPEEAAMYYMTLKTTDGDEIGPFNLSSASTLPVATARLR